METKNYLKVEEVAKLFGVNNTTIYRLAQSGKMPGFKVGNQWRFNLEQLRHWEVQQMRQLLTNNEKHPPKKEGK